MALLHVFLALKEEYELELFVAHYHHFLRKEAQEEALFVKREAERLGLPFILGASPVKTYASREKISLEAAGRELRYRFFERVAEEYGLNKIALAHQADDLAEEVLLRFIRGAGRRGLAGIPVKRGGLFIRPLLMISREEILTFLEEKGIPFVDDPSNRDPRFLRNKVRHLLIPFLERHFHKKVKECLKRTALLVAEEEEFLGCLALENLQKYGRLKGEAFHLSVRGLKNVPLALRRRIYLEALKAIGVPLFRVRLSHLEQIERLLLGKTRGDVDLPGGFLARREPGRLVFKPLISSTSSFALEIEGPGEYPLPWGGKLKVYFETSSRNIPNALSLDPQKASFPLRVRSPQPGDRIRVPGLEGSKKLKKIFWEKKLSHEARRLWPIIEKDGQIIAVANFVVAEGFLPSGPESLVLEFEGLPQ
ncbi:MAG: tRNA lysidine(34) synthetase TilS [Thermodesulfobacteria bacterium]|nr:tRNA lysidine(34) synthetase TilS [Thermodesulfobacteriota bacterium]